MIKPDNPIDPARRRDWLAALLLSRPEGFLSRLTAGLTRWRAIPRHYRRRLARRVAATAAATALIAAMAGGSLFVQPAHAATITVNETTCTLIDAIVAANTDTASGGCIAGDAGLDTIDLQADVLLTASYGYYYSSDTGLPLVTSEIVIEGNGFTIERDAGADPFRILAVSSTGDLTLNDVTISGGNTVVVGAYGGGVYNHGSLTLTGSTVSGNTAYIFGGGVHNDEGTVTISHSAFSDNHATFDEGGAIAHFYGTMTITASTFSGNTAFDDGGAIVNYYGTMTITGSTFSGNSANYGGAIYNDDQMTITNSTFSGNSANHGGAIFNIDDLTITNSTFSGNSADENGGGLYNFAYGTATLARSLISGNQAPDGREVYNFDNPSYSGTINADEYNVFGYDNDAGTVNFTPGASDIVPGAGVLLADILDTTLAGNGGPTETHLLVDGSPALDFAPDADCAAAPTDGVDQRGATRPFDVVGQGNEGANTCDAGAVEADAPFVGGAEIFMSTRTAGTTADGLDFGPEDIIWWNGVEWTTFLDGSAAGLEPNNAKHNINAFSIPDPEEGDFIFSLGQNRRHVPDIAAPVDGMDLVYWNALTEEFSAYFDGQDVGLTNKTQEKIDGLHWLPGSESPINGGECEAYLLISTQGPGKVPNYTGGQLKFSGEDVLGFCATSLGETTAGLWHLVLDGSLAGMPRNSTDSISVSDDGETMYLTTQGAFAVDSAVGGHSMVYRYDFATDEFSGPFFVAAAEGLDEKVDGLHIEGELP